MRHMARLFLIAATLLPSMAVHAATNPALDPLLHCTVHVSGDDSRWWVTVAGDSQAAQLDALKALDTAGANEMAYVSSYGLRSATRGSQPQLQRSFQISYNRTYYNNTIRMLESLGKTSDARNVRETKSVEVLLSQLLAIPNVQVACPGDPYRGVTSSN